MSYVKKYGIHIKLRSYKFEFLVELSFNMVSEFGFGEVSNSSRAWKPYVQSYLLEELII